ncbi:MAG: glycosyltransferase family protein [Bacteriovoracaceae bacterium]|nr:glycosyltransferase family protein [Bacteriovoracaceae bacterium]
MSIKTVVIVQARMGSTRLPGKVLNPLEGIPLLEHVCRRIQSSKLSDLLVIATSIDPNNDPIDKLCDSLGIECFRGSEEDVLGRFYCAAVNHKPEYVVRITADCPLVDPEIIDHAINLISNGGYDYVSNTEPPTYPDGYDVEVFKFEALKKAHHGAEHKYQREHVTSYITENQALFKCHSFAAPEDLSHMRLTVDTSEDFEVIKLIYSSLYSKNHLFSYEEVVQFLKKNPQILELNSHFERNEGYDTTDT